MYFFKGNRYWRFSPNKRLDDGFPKNINDGFEGIPANVDAAFVWGRNDKIYFFKGSNYYKFDPKKNPPVDESYPRPMSNWDGIPNNIDAALQYSNGNTYFFKNNQYYRSACHEYTNLNIESRKVGKFLSLLHLAGLKMCALPFLVFL